VRHRDAVGEEGRAEAGGAAALDDLFDDDAEGNPIGGMGIKVR
jgi:hypothetical protein